MLLWAWSRPSRFPGTLRSCSKALFPRISLHTLFSSFYHVYCFLQLLIFILSGSSLFLWLPIFLRNILHPEGIPRQVKQRQAPRGGSSGNSQTCQNKCDYLATRFSLLSPVSCIHTWDSNCHLEEYHVSVCWGVKAKLKCYIFSYYVLVAFFWLNV